MDGVCPRENGSSRLLADDEVNEVLGVRVDTVGPSEDSEERFRHRPEPFRNPSQMSPHHLVIESDDNPSSERTRTIESPKDSDGVFLDGYHVLHRTCHTPWRAPDGRRSWARALRPFTDLHGPP